MSIDLSQWKDLVERTARFTAADFPEVSQEDLEQDLYLFLLEKRTLKPDVTGAATILAKAAKLRAWEYRKNDLSKSTQYNYRPSDVRKMLENAFDMSKWETGWVPDDAIDDDHRASVDMRADIKWAYEELPDNYKKIILMKYGLQYELNATQSKALSRAVLRLVDILNFYRNPVLNEKTIIGKRRVMSNAKARAILEMQWEE